MLNIKQGVSLLGAAPQVAIGVCVCHSVFASMGEVCTITSCTDGKHGPHSHHKKGCAFDLRIRSLKTSALTIVEMVQDALGNEFQVILEKTHIHVEYDPI